MFHGKILAAESANAKVALRMAENVLAADQNGGTRKAIADRLGLDLSTLDNLLSSGGGGLKLNHLEGIATVLGVQLFELFLP